MTTSTELSLPQRAAVALGTAEHEQRLIALVKESERIIDVKNKAGRDECHTAYMVLKNTRISITGLADNATEDAKAFTKAVKAEALRLLDITKAEESRLQELRDAFDAQVQAEKDAKIAAERARVERIQADIQSIRNTAMSAIGKPSEYIRPSIEILEGMGADEGRFAEFAPDAATAIGETLDALVDLYSKAIASEAAAIRIQQEREAAEAQAQKDREELAAAQAKLKADQEAAAAELKRQQAEQAAEMQKQRDAMAEEMKAERERAEVLRKLEDDKRRFEQKEREKQEKAQQAAMDARQRDLDHSEGLLMNAQFDQLAAARKLEDETAAAAVVEPVAAHVVEAPQGNECITYDRQAPVRPTDNQLLMAIATSFGVDLSDALEWLSTFGQ